MLEYIRDLESTGNYKPADIIPIHVIRERKVFYNTVSAGTGSFLDSDEYEMISSPDIPEAATFGVYVDGDSMELDIIIRISSGLNRQHALMMAK